jgi:hypothetical protein
VERESRVTIAKAGSMTIDCAGMTEVFKQSIPTARGKASSRRQRHCVLPIAPAWFATIRERSVPIPARQRGDIVIIDNPGSHKGRAVRGAIRAAGQAVLPAGLEPRPQSDRPGLGQAQNIADGGAICYSDDETGHDAR